MDAVLLHRVANGSDHAVRLAAILTYVGVDDSYTLARACGISALVFVYFAMALGLWADGRRSASAGPGTRSLVHRSAGLVALALVAAHAVIPYLSLDPPYGGWRTNFAPFAQPSSWGIHAASWESLGILSFYLLLLTGPVFYLLRSRPRAWVVIHRLTAVVYALAVAHVFLLGTDFLVHGPARVAVLAAQVPILLLLGRRLWPRGRASGSGWHWAGALAAAASSAAMAALTVAVATGEYSPGMRL